MWFFFALAAVALPIIALLLYSSHTPKKPWIYSLGSFLLFSLMCMDEFFTLYRRCFSGDFGGIEDTIGAVVLVTGFAAVAVLLLNALLLGVYYSREK